jgi:hypothetical protein
MSTRYAVFTAVASIVLSHAAGAQRKPAASDTTTPRFTTGSTQIGAGYIKFDFADLGDRLAAAGLPRAASGAATIGLNSDIRYGSLLLGVGFQSLITESHSDASYKTSLAGRYMLLDAGLTVLKTRNWSVSPIAGVGATSMSVYVREQGEFTFDEGLARPSRQLGMSGLGAVAHGGVLIERRFQRGESEYAFALRAGATRGFGSQSWMSDMGKVNEGPRGIRGSYLRLAFSRPMRHRRDVLGTAVGTAAQAVVR